MASSEKLLDQQVDGLAAKYEPPGGLKAFVVVVVLAHWSIVV